MFPDNEKQFFRTMIFSIGLSGMSGKFRVWVLRRGINRGAKWIFRCSTDLRFVFCDESVVVFSLANRGIRDESEANYFNDLLTEH